MDDHLAGLPPEQAAALARVRAIAEEVVPEAEEGVSYGMSENVLRDVVRARKQELAASA
jgi:uncharacterized protein YdhG (YjbR/CyaY superfamily)